MPQLALPKKLKCRSRYRGQLLSKLIFVAQFGALIPNGRPTDDVDIVLELKRYSGLAAIEEKVRKKRVCPR
jgi:hypothetical protein